MSLDVAYSVVRVQGLKAARPRWRITPPTWPRIWSRAMLGPARLSPPVLVPGDAGPGGVGVSASGGLVVAGLGLLGMRAYDPAVVGLLVAPHRTY